MNNFDSNRWYPIASVADLPSRHVFHTALGDQELAIWRDDNGFINAWENRCPHRGLRLTLGTNLGDSLRCQYHGWTYETGSGSCKFVPAHPESPPPPSSATYTFAVREALGLVWTSLGEPAGEPQTYKAGASAQSGVALRGLPVEADLAHVMGELRKEHERFAEFFGVAVDVLQITPLSDEALEVSVRGASQAIRLFLQPYSSHKTVIHAQSTGVTSVELRSHKLFADILNELRRIVEKRRCNGPQVGEVRTALRGASAQQTTPLRRTNGSEYTCQVVARVQETDEIMSLRLKPMGKAMPQFTPGMHLSVTTPSGCVRQYSIVNGPAEQDVFIVGIKREAESRGGSRSMHDDVSEGTELQVSVQRNGFPLKRTGRKPVLIAGGIGITPILSMAQALSAGDAEFELHYFVRSETHVPFRSRFDALRHATHIYTGLDVSATRNRIEAILGVHAASDIDVYVCGPGPMIETVRQLALQLGVQDDAVRFEYFENAMTALDGDAFDVYLARSGTSFTVPEGKTLLEVCAEHGVSIESSCEQGVCGTCMTAVVDGLPDHRDLYLTRQEQESGKWIMPCVSRAKSGTLVLDL